MTRPLPLVQVLHFAERQDYSSLCEDMRAFTDQRTATTADALWCLEHTPVYTLGQAGRREHLHAPGAIAVVQSDRGGQVTYHGPGQLVVYTLLDIRRLGIGIKSLVHRLEAAIIDTLAEQNVAAMRRSGAPGVYVEGEKIAAIGLRVRRGCTYHGLSLNVDLDLSPFEGIDPCGYRDLKATSLAELGVVLGSAEVATALVPWLCHHLGLPIADNALMTSTRCEDS